MSLIHPSLRQVRLPVFASPLFIISVPQLVIAQCKAGVIGSFPALNARPKEALDAWLTNIRDALHVHDLSNPSRPSAPFAVNQIVHRSNDRLEHDLDVCVAHKVPIVITSLGARREVNDAVHGYGGIVLHDVIDNTFAKKAIDKGADGLIAVATGAGGHAGFQSPFALVQEIRAWFDGPLLLSGAIASGRSIAAALTMGADFAYVGSAFIATQEANASDEYKRMIVESTASDIIHTNFVTGVHGNYLKPSMLNAGLDPDNLPMSDASKMDFSNTLRRPKAWKGHLGMRAGNRYSSRRP